MSAFMKILCLLGLRSTKAEEDPAVGALCAEVSVLRVLYAACLEKCSRCEYFGSCGHCELATPLDLLRQHYSQRCRRKP